MAQPIVDRAESLAPARDFKNKHYQEVKSRLHEQLLNRLNLERLAEVKRDEAEPELRSVIGALLEKESERTPLSLYERENLVVDVLNELFGLGPLEELLADPEISDILVNRHDVSGHEIGSAHGSSPLWRQQNATLGREPP